MIVLYYKIMNEMTDWKGLKMTTFVVRTSKNNKNNKTMKKLLTLLFSLMLVMTASAEKRPVFIYAGQSNADGREYVQNLPNYMKVGSSPYSPYTHLKWASICGNPTKKAFDTRKMATGERYAFCDVTNYWIDQAVTEDFYAIKCAYGGTAIAPGVTVEKLPIWYADATWMQTHNAYSGQDITQEAYKNNNSLTKNLTEGVASLIDGTLAALDAGYDVKAIMWHQGESDRNAAGSYYTNFKTMIQYMRNAIYQKTGDPADLTLPFIFGTVCRRSTQYSTGVEEAQKQVARDLENVYVIDMKNATLLSDNLHFDKQATEFLGKKMYNKLVELGLVNGDAVEVEEFPVKESVMDNVEVPTPDNRSWDFTSSAWSQATKDALSAEVALTSGSLWNWNNGYGYRRGNSVEEEQLHTSGGYVFPETEGLYFTSAVYNRIATKFNGLYFVSGDPTIFIPKMTAGQLIYVTARASSTVTLRPGIDMDDYVEVVGSGEVGTSSTVVTFRVKYNVTLPTHIGIKSSGAVYIDKIQVKTPETVNILIGADQKETFSCDQPLDFSPFTDLFKAYVVTGYDDAGGVVECEQVLQVPANTGVLLIGEESTVNAPIIEGAAPEAPAVNLLTAVVGSGTAPAGSFVLATSGGETQLAKTANAVALNNQAYIETLGNLSTYGFSIVEPREEHVYNIAGGSILAKGTALTVGSSKHHTLKDGNTNKDVYLPKNADGLEGRFAFDNSGKWAVDGNNYRLGANSKNTLYFSVLSLVNGDRVKLEWGANDAAAVHVYELAGILRGVSAGGEITNGGTYVVEAGADEVVNIDLKMYCGSNRAGLTKMTVWTDNEIEVVTTPVSVAKFDGNRKAAVSYTFDDGIQDQYTLAYPEMKKRGIRATFGIIGSKVGGTIKATGVPDVPAMTWDQIREMYADGFEIASHGYNHKNLTSLDDEARTAEVVNNDNLIEQEVGQRPLTFIYPYNGKSDEIVAWIESNHVGSRTYQQSMGGSSNELTMNSYVDGLISNGSWGVTMTHSIAEGYDHFQDPQRLFNHWDYVITLQDELWVAPFHEVAGYVRERDNAVVTTESEDENNIALSVSTTLEDKTMFSYPLTLLVETYADGATQDGKALTVKYKNGQTIISGVNPNGGNVTIHKSSSEPLAELTKPTVSATLTAYASNNQLRQALVTLTGSEAAATYYYKGGDAADWTAIAGTSFVPTKKGVYSFKAVADGYTDSDPTRGVALAPLYKASQMIDLTDLDLYASVTGDKNAFNWGDDWGFDANQEFGKINTANIGIISVQNSNLAARYSYAKGIGLANNYGYTYGSNTGSSYSFAEYQLYQNHSLTDITTKIVHNPTTSTLNFPSQKNGALKGATIWEPATTIDITIGDTGYATFSCDQAVDFTSSGIAAYYATQDGDDVKFDNAIVNPAAATGLLLKATPGNYEVSLVNEGTDVSGVNLLKACLEEKTVGTTAGCDYGKVFILSKHNNQLGFYRSNNGRTLLAGMSYLYIENASAARMENGFPFDGHATGIDALPVNGEQRMADSVYDLKGQQVVQPAKGLYIVNGKKIIVK